MAKGHRSKIKRERNEVRDTRPSAKLSYARVSVQKACFVLDAIRGKSVNEALAIVTYNPRYASSLVKKLLESAIANAENNYPEKNYKAENLYVAECFANKGPTMKRIHPRACLLYTSSHILMLSLSRDILRSICRSMLTFRSLRITIQGAVLAM